MKRSPQYVSKVMERKYPILYIKEVNHIKYVGYDISELGVSNKIVEVIKLNDSPIQVRQLKEQPFYSLSIQFGGF